MTWASVVDLPHEHYFVKENLLPREYQICARCVMDTTVPNIRFDDDGVCQFCHIHDELEKSYPLGEKGKHTLDEIVTEIKSAGRGKPYDCVCGVSGGRDSTYSTLR